MCVVYATQVSHMVNWVEANRCEECIRNNAIIDMLTYEVMTDDIV